MTLDIPSFIFGIIIAIAVMIVGEYIFGKFFGQRKIKQLQREVNRLKRIVQKKDDLIRKSLKELEEKEKNSHE